METLILKGKHQTLMVQAEIYHHTWESGNYMSGDRDSSKTCWRGQIVLVHINGQSLIFNFTSRQHHDILPANLPSLVNEIMPISFISKNAEIVEKENVVDLFCDLLSKTVKEERSKSKLFVVVIELPILDGEPLVNKGLISEPGHQIEMINSETV